jgi:hypothetical protein
VTACPPPPSKPQHDHLEQVPSECHGRDDQPAGADHEEQERLPEPCGPSWRAISGLVGRVPQSSGTSTIVFVLTFLGTTASPIALIDAFQGGGGAFGHGTMCFYLNCLAGRRGREPLYRELVGASCR